MFLKENFAIPAESLLEYITNLSYRHFWVQGVDKFEYNENEVTRLGSEHVCVINNKHFNFVAVKKKVKPGKYVYGEITRVFLLQIHFINFILLVRFQKIPCQLESRITLGNKIFNKETTNDSLWQKGVGEEHEKWLGFTI